MVTAYLFFVDLSVPLVFGLINYFLYSDENISEYYFYLYLIFSLSIYVLSLAKDYYRLSLDYDESDVPNESTKTLKRKMRNDIRKIDNQVIPALENISK